MKDLKHYFTSPVESDNEMLNGNECVSKKRRIPCLSESVDYSTETHDAIKKKKKKKKKIGPEKQNDTENDFCVKSVKKRKKDHEEISPKKPKISKACENVNNHKSEEYSKKLSISNHNIVQERSLDSSTEFKPSDIGNNLQNYFNPVNKSEETLLKTNVLKVEAVVHYPPSERSVKPPKRLKTRLRRRKSMDLRPEYDIITSEEDNSVLPNFKKETSLNNVLILDKASSEELLTSPESFKEQSCTFNETNSNVNGNGNALSLRIKHDGTLNSFFKISNRMSDSPSLEICEEKKIARKEFLNSGVPERMRKLIDKKRIMLLEFAPFPKYHHVTQADLLNLIWNLKFINLELKSHYDYLLKLPAWSNITKLPDKNVELKECLTSSVKLQNKKILKKLKKEISGQPTEKWFTELFKMKQANAYDMWSEKYKPKSSQHILGNSYVVEKLKSWLQDLNNSKAHVKKGKVCNCSDDDFLKFEDESDDGNADVKSTAFLLGPSGCGKTAAVYSLAEEIGYQILEINSTSSRMGKKILHEFSEALQSHKVESNVLNFCGPKKNKTEESRKSLVLIEDVDVIFPDYDDGFISTIATLAANSKRPMIFTVNEYHSKNLAKILPFMQFKLHYKHLSQDKLHSWIRIVAAAENVFLDEHEASKIIRWANGDIRKLLLQLQFSFAANSSKVVCPGSYKMKNLWEKVASHRLDAIEETKSTAKLCNLLTVYDVLNGSLNPQPTDETFVNIPWHSALRDSCEHNQPNESVDYLTRNMLSDMIQVLEENILLTNSESLSLRHENQSVIPIVEHDVIAPSSVVCHKCVAIDYLPALRIMARSEIKRLESHSKRNNRYFSYMQSIGITENTVKISNILSETFNNTFSILKNG